VIHFRALVEKIWKQCVEVVHRWRWIG